MYWSLTCGPMFAIFCFSTRPILLFPYPYFGLKGFLLLSCMEVGLQTERFSYFAIHEKNCCLCLWYTGKSEAFLLAFITYRFILAWCHLQFRCSRWSCVGWVHAFHRLLPILWNLIHGPSVLLMVTHAIQETSTQLLSRCFNTFKLLKESSLLLVTGTHLTFS